MNAHNRVGLLHTVPALAESFSSALTAEHRDIESVHIVDAALLATAISDGVTDEVTARVAAHIGYLADAGAQAILVTCSSIAEAAEAAPSRVPVVRVDAAMAERAVTLATRAARSEDREGHVEVLATLEATIGPTSRLLERFAEEHPDVTIDVTIVDGAADAKDRGDQSLYASLIRDAAVEFAGRSDVLVLAQASMADALDGVELPVPVLTSPAGGVRALLTALRSRNNSDPTTENT